jgi:hypothetical protein
MCSAVHVPKRYGAKTMFSEVHILKKCAAKNYVFCSTCSQEMCC